MTTEDFTKQAAAMVAENVTVPAQRSGSRTPTVEEAEAMLTLVRGGWLKLELALDATPGEAQ